MTDTPRVDPRRPTTALANELRTLEIRLRQLADDLRDTLDHLEHDRGGNDG